MKIALCDMHLSKVGEMEPANVRWGYAGHGGAYKLDLCPKCYDNLMKKGEKNFPTEEEVLEIGIAASNAVRKLMP